MIYKEDRRNEKKKRFILLRQTAMVEFFKLPRLDSNQDTEIQNLMSYH